MPEKFTERPAIGTRVYLRGCPGIWTVGNQAGTVYREGASGKIVWVVFDNGQKDYGEWRDLRPEAPEAAEPTPEAVIIGGKRYVLAEPPEAPEVKREPKQGEIWRDSAGKLCLLLRNDKNAVLENAGQGSWGYRDFARLGTYAYPSLAAAIEAGETFK